MQKSFILMNTFFLNTIYFYFGLKYNTDMNLYKIHTHTHWVLLRVLFVIFFCWIIVCVLFNLFEMCVKMCVGETFCLAVRFSIINIVALSSDLDWSSGLLPCLLSWCHTHLGETFQRAQTEQNNIRVNLREWACSSPWSPHPVVHFRQADHTKLKNTHAAILLRHSLSHQ